jgi:hypothetical protein
MDVLRINSVSGSVLNGNVFSHKGDLKIDLSKYKMKN